MNIKEGVKKRVKRGDDLIFGNLAKDYFLILNVLSLHKASLAIMLLYFSKFFFCMKIK